MATLDKETIKYLTQLSRIDCTEEEQASLLHDLEEILGYFEKLNEVDTEGAAPCNNVLEDVVNVMREDEVGEILPRDVFLANAPSHVGGLIRVPIVIKQRAK